jgi:hypothetical protein
MKPSLFKCCLSVVVSAFWGVASAQNQPEITTKSLPIGTSGVPYSATLGATGGVEPYTWSVRTGKLPSGLELNPANGVISGTPSSQIAATGGSKLSTFLPLPLVFQVKDSNGLIATANLPINVASPIVIETTALPDATVGTSYSFCLVAKGGNLAYNSELWRVADGALPKSITLGEDQECRGLLSGIPSKAGKFPVQIRVADFQGRSAQASFVLTIKKRARPR